tara:strand:- start:2450 stop:3622 length:1173 start_codon:yes stop_codon:yes gene_type:complete
VEEQLSFTPMVEDRVDLLIVAGEASGDEHASFLVKELKTRFPELKIAALGGRELEENGVHLLFNLVQHAVVGFFEVLKNYSFFRRLLIQTKEWIRTYQPKAVLLVDYPGFNLRLAGALKREGISCKGGGQVRMLQYISPQLWAWKPKRRFQMEKIIDSVGVLFPFEVDCYKDVDLPVSFLGHPYVASGYQSSIRYDKDGPLLLLPGSRVQPVERILPVFLEAYENILERFPELNACIPVPDQKIQNLVNSILLSFPMIKERVQVHRDAEDLIGRVALMSSGTMSLACALEGMPGAIGYKAHPITYFLGKRLIRVPSLGMANLLLPENPPYPEYIQGRATRKNLSKEIERILDNKMAPKEFSIASRELKEILSQPQDCGLIDWVIEEGGFE